jgi:hypothetical protein
VRSRSFGNLRGLLGPERVLRCARRCSRKLRRKTFPGLLEIPLYRLHRPTFFAFGENPGPTQHYSILCENHVIYVIAMNSPRFGSYAETASEGIELARKLDLIESTLLPGTSLAPVNNGATTCRLPWIFRFSPDRVCRPTSILIFRRGSPRAGVSGRSRPLYRTQFEQFTMDLWSAPNWIFAAQGANQLPHFLRNPPSPKFPRRIFQVQNKRNP